ncbi:hypothetical protein ACQPZX_24085 [Actinoplanes sp. CA-142083]|uniref:hypothetical protein n=1 Tax=Actinoplanes sp. CA-142083 TaxID=3239903 RepID=UPI003D920831
MATEVVLGEVTCPSGQLVIMDGGYVELWSGDQVPDDEENPATDFAIEGADAEAAAASFDRQTGTRLYDIPVHAVADLTDVFDEHCREHGLDAWLRAFERQVPHRERVRHAVAARESGFGVTGVPVLSMEAPAGRALRVTAVPGKHGWQSMRIELGDAPVADSWEFGELGVDHARLVFADADALGSWEHTGPLDGLVLSGRDHEAGVIEIGGASVLMAMTSVGDGFFLVHLDVDADGIPVALRIDLAGEH